MKKIVMMLAVGALVGTVGFAAYAHYEDYYRGRGVHAPRGGDMRYGPHGGMIYGRGHSWGMGRGGRGGGMYGQGPMQGRGGRWGSAGNATCPCGANYGRWNRSAGFQQGTAPDMLSEEKIKESAQKYLTKYLSGYSIKRVEKDGWRPLYFITVTGQNGAVQKMIVHGFSGQIMHVYPEDVVEETPAE